MSDLTPLEDALKIVLDTVPVLGIEKINLLDALGRVLAEDRDGAHHAEGH